jgi:mRNA-degrading endonuclease RelE of RelBE toxin-antitoxin system
MGKKYSEELFGVMSRRNIKIIRAAFREIQKLSPAALAEVYKILHRLSQGDEKHTKPLRGYKNLLRTRWGDWRVIWQKDGDNILVIKAGLRGGFYDDVFDRCNHLNPVTPDILEKLLHPQGTALAENPAYQWNQEKDTDWYKFVYGSYRHAPQLTDYQRTILDEPLTKLLTYPHITPDTFEEHGCIVFQSAPGTGKTVCASLFASEIHHAYGWNTMLIVPEALRRDIAEYSQVKQSLNQENFWLGTFPQWLGKINPDFNDNLASPQQELEALRKAIKYTKETDINHTDVLLYQAFVLQEQNQQQDKNVMYKANYQRINRLLNINKKHWYNALACRLCRLDAAKLLQSKIHQPVTHTECSILIVDEAQDLLLSELQAIIAVCKSWIEQGHPTYLWLLGDLNQRISPTDFTWNQLKIRNTVELRRNYRNSRQILEFANQFCRIGQKISSQVGAKKLPEPAQPEDAFATGERVRLLECSSKTEALEFLQELAGETKNEENRRHLLHDLANAVKVFSTQSLNSSDSLLILNPEQAKGREFEACVAFCLFEGYGTPSLAESFQWYTLLTRARSRLLIVATKSEISRLNALGNDHFSSCDRVDGQTAIQWVTEVASDMDLNQITDDVQQRLLKRCESGCLYWDTYLALQFAGVRDGELYQWEQKAIALLSQHPPELLNQELQQTENISLRCLILRAMHCSWQAVEVASPLKNTDVPEYERLLKAIAKDLEKKGLPYEAARVRAYLVDGNYKYNLPFWQEIINPSHQSKPLVALLCEAFNHRLASYILQNREMEAC